MKKTLVALTVAALAATSAQAVTVLDKDGSTINFDGSLRLIMDKNVSKTTPNGGATSRTSNSALKNSGSRFGVTTKHQLGEDFYALSRLEFRFDGNPGRDGFGSLTTKRAYVGLGSNQAGEVTFGRQVTIADDLSQAADYAYGLIPKGAYIPTDGSGVIRYDYKGVEGLQVGANYNFGADTETDPLSNTTPKAKITIKHAYGLGVLYAQDAADVRFAYGHTNYETGFTTVKHRKDGYLASLGYKFGDFKLTGDFGYAQDKDGQVKTDKYYLSPGFQYQVIPASKVYGNYLYENAKAKEVEKTTTNAFLLGVDYKFHKQVVAFVEGKYAVKKEYNYTAAGSYDYNSKTADRAIGVGMRVFW